jgi:hypothetical protein
MGGDIMDSTLAAGIVGGACAIAGSIVSHVLLFLFERRKLRDDRRMVALEYSLIFCEKCKLGQSRRLADEDYYHLVKTLALLDSDLRRDIIGIYQDCTGGNAPLQEIMKRASALQEVVANQMK